jgi:predicted nucleic acid-binding protein
VHRPMPRPSVCLWSILRRWRISGASCAKQESPQHQAVSKRLGLRWAILDTSVYIGHWETGRYDDLLLDVQRAFIVHHCAVVLSELRRGARNHERQRIVERLHATAHTIWEPDAENWWETGKLVRDVGDSAGWEMHKRREFQNDALIALTARRHGATVVTANREDLSFLRSSLRMAVIYA